MIGPAGQPTETRYHDGFSPRLVVAPDGGAVRFTYGEMGRLAVTEHLSADPEAPGATPALAWSEHRFYDPAGNAVTVERRDGSGAPTWRDVREYDVQHRMTRRLHPEHPERAASWVYRPAGSLEQAVDEEGRAKTFENDVLGRPAIVTASGPAPGGGTISQRIATYGHPRSGSLISEFLDGKGTNHQYQHDDFGRIERVEKVGMWHGFVAYRYDSRGNTIGMKKGDEIAVTYAYDGLDRLTTLTARNSADGMIVTYTYAYDSPGAEGLLASVTDAGRTIRYEYDTAGRLVKERVEEAGVAVPLVTEYRYGPHGALAEAWYPSGTKVRYVRDPATGQVARVEDSVSGTAWAESIAHLPGGPMTYALLGNGLGVTRTHNLRYEPTSINSGPLSLGLEIGPAGDVKGMTEEGTTATLGYDFLDRLVESPGWFTYSYDAAGNRQAETVDGASLTYTLLSDWLSAVSVPGSTAVTKYSFAHDYQSTSGIGVYDAQGATVVQAVCLRHDPLGRLVSVGYAATPSRVYPNATTCTTESQMSSVIARFRYDHQNRRIARWLASTGEWTYFIHDGGGQPLSEIAYVGGSTPWAPRRDYVWLEGSPLAQLEHGPGGRRSYYVHADHLGLPRKLTSQAGAVVWSARTRPYGELAQETATPDPESGATVVTNLRLPGQYDERLLGSLGLQGPYYNWNRWYLPGVGRYLEADPLALAGHFNTSYGVDWYGYASQNPLRFIDPAGLCTVMCVRQMIAPTVWLCFRATDEQDSCKWYNPKKYLWQFEGQFTGELPAQLVGMYGCSTWDNDIRPRLNQGSFPVPYIPPFPGDPRGPPPGI